MRTAIYVATAYLCGSLPSAVIVAKRYGKNILTEGTGNVGFANAYRALGLKPALVVLGTDVAKGYLPMLLAAGCSMQVRLAVGLAVIAGHVWMPWLRFRGGKGVATGLGVVLQLAPWAALVGVMWYSLVLYAGQKFAFASMLGVFSLPIVAVMWYPVQVGYFSLLVVIVQLTHWRHIVSLFTGRPVIARGAMHE